MILEQDGIAAGISVRDWQFNYGRKFDKMTKLRKDAFTLLEQMPEDKLVFIVQIMQGVKGIYADEDNSNEREEAFERLEKMRKKADHLDYDKELASYREEKYGI